MRGVLFLLAAVVLAALLVRVSMEDPGYVLISRAPHEVEISLSLFLLVLLGVDLDCSLLKIDLFKEILGKYLLKKQEC